jgi:hypothetical protein
MDLGFLFWDVQNRRFSADLKRAKFTRLLLSPGHASEAFCAGELSILGALAFQRYGRRKLALV